MKKLITFSLCLLLNGIVFSQSSPIKLGKPSDDEIALEKCEFYPEAKSMILSDFGYLTFSYHDDKGWRFNLEVSTRRKIFNDPNKEFGTVKIKYYSPKENSTQEIISNIKGYVINGSGKDETIKLDKESVYTTRLNDYWSEISITFPQVQNGSILDLSYIITSDLITNLKTWEFQQDVPVARSEFVCLTPEFFNYQVSHEGTPIELEVNNDIKDETFTYKYRTENTQSGLRSTGSAFSNNTGVMESTSVKRQFIANSVPPIDEEPYMNNRPNIPARVEFQMTYQQFKGQDRKIIATDYASFNKELLSKPYFGLRMKDGGFIDPYLPKLESLSLTNKAGEIFKIIKSNITWDGYHNFLSSDAGRKTFKDGTGNVAAMNLTFIAACRQAGINCDPVILNTRGNGVPHPFYPSYDRFNYVIAMIQTESGYLLVDTSSDLPFGSLPIKCRNGNGYIITEDGGRWMELKQASNHVSNTMVNYTISEDQIIGSISTKEEGYKAINTLHNYHKDGEEKVLSTMKNSLGDWELAEATFDQIEWGEPVKYAYEIRKEVDDQTNIYLQPVILTYLDENPFKRNTRNSPIDFAHSIYERTIVQMQLPEGYSADLPESSIVKLPEDKASFSYASALRGNQIQITVIFKQDETDFTPQEYELLKQFYQLAVDKVNEVIVLKKI